MEHALLPKDLETPTLEVMLEGESAWTVPWAMWVDVQRRCWLHPRYTTRNKPGGTVTMKVTRTTEGYEVTVQGDHTWEPRATPGFIGQVDAWLPVTKFSR